MTDIAGRPDILVVLSDQQRPDSCGVFGQMLNVTPVLDELASDGVAFDESFTVQPLCGPARSVIQTGQMPTATGCWRNGRSLPRGVVTLADRLSASGYSTGYIGKWHLASDGGYLPRPGRSAISFATRPIPADRRGGYRDTWIAADALEMTSGPYGGHMFDASNKLVDLHGYRVDAITDLVIDNLRRRNDDTPSFLFVSYLEPHHQNNRMRSIGPEGWAKRFSEFEVPPDLVGRLGDWRWNYAEYLACCASIDANLGRIVAVLKEMGTFDNTLVVYSSDHGSHFRTRNLEYKRSAHDASIRVPLVIRGPGFRGGLRSDALVSNLDLVPTLATAAGAELDADLTGMPLQQQINGGGGAGRDSILVQVSESEIGRAIRTRDYTYAVKANRFDRWAGYRHGAAPRYRGHLFYDLKADPAQRHNLVHSSDFEEERHRLADVLLGQIERFEGNRPEIDPR